MEGFVSFELDCQSDEWIRSRTHVDAFIGETGWDGGAFFFGFREEDGEFLDGRHGNVAPVVPGEEGLKYQHVRHRFGYGMYTK